MGRVVSSVYTPPHGPDLTACHLRVYCSFVERSELGWDDSAGKHVTLTRMLSEGSIIFVRPIQPMAMHRANPIPYEAEFVGCSPEGNHQFRLNGVQPRHSRLNYTVN